jgi:hypothetical protein
VPGLRRPTPDRGLRELTRRLAEEYDQIPLPEISRIVQEAVTAATGPGHSWGGTREGIPTFIEVVEFIAREDLELISGAAGESQSQRRLSPQPRSSGSA